MPADGSEFLALVEKAVAAGNADTPSFATALGLHRGVSGYVYHTVPVVIHAWLRFPRNFRGGVDAVIRCGGDADSTAAIVGGIIGAGVGKAGIPEDWLAGIWEWPRSRAWMERLDERLAAARQSGQPSVPPRLSVPGLVARNLVFLLIVLLHIVRRVLPPC